MILKMNFNFNFIRIAFCGGHRQRATSREVVIYITRGNQQPGGDKRSRHARWLVPVKTLASAVRAASLMTQI